MKFISFIEETGQHVFMFIFLCIAYYLFLGTKPAPRTWDKWNFEGIEPGGLRKGGMSKEDVEKGWKEIT